MNKLNRSVLFLLLPVIYFLSAYILKSAQGPYYLNFYDPGYVYMISSLNIAQGFGVGHFDHPGTTVQVIGALIVRAYFFITGKDPDIAADVLSRPEDYMYVLNTMLILINAFVLFTLGLIAYRLSKNIYLSILLQLSPFTSMEIFYGSIIVSPDNFLITVSLFLICALLYYWFRINDDEYPPLKFILIFGIICGLGLATKLNFIPLVFIPFFLIKGYKNKILFWIFTVISFLIFISPILFDISQFAQWIERLVINSGKHGRGESNVVNTDSFLINLKMIFSKDAVFTISYFTLILSFLFSLVRYFKEKNSGVKYFTKLNKILMSLLFAISFQILLVAKHYAQYYLIPSMMLSIVIFIVSIFVILPVFENTNKKIKPEFFYASVFILIFLWSSVSIYRSYKEAVNFKNEALKPAKFLQENYPDNMLISSFTSANNECALAFAVRYAADKRSEYEKIISQNNKEQIFYNVWNNVIFKTSDPGSLKKDLLSKGNEKIILQLRNGTPEKFAENINQICNVDNTVFKEVFSNDNGERIYEVTIGK